LRDVMASVPQIVRHSVMNGTLGQKGPRRAVTWTSWTADQATISYAPEAHPGIERRPLAELAPTCHQAASCPSAYRTEVSVAFWLVARATNAPNLGCLTGTSVDSRGQSENRGSSGRSSTWTKTAATSLG
jgi:hypothetical protein